MACKVVSIPYSRNPCMDTVPSRAENVMGVHEVREHRAVGSALNAENVMEKRASRELRDLRELARARLRVVSSDLPTGCLLPGSRRSRTSPSSPFSRPPYDMRLIQPHEGHHSHISAPPLMVFLETE
jgi:hypothetical protein